MMNELDFETLLQKYLFVGFVNKYCAADEVKKQSLSEKLKLILSQREVVQQLSKRIRKGNKHDVNKFVETNFSTLPLGLRRHLVHDVLKLYKGWHETPKSIMNIGSSLDSAEVSVADKLVSRWQHGVLNPIDFHHEIFKSIQSGDLQLHVAEKLLSSMISEAGYSTRMTKADFDATKRMKFNTYEFDLVSLCKSYISYDGCEINLLSYDNQLVNISRHPITDSDTSAASYKHDNNDKYSYNITNIKDPISIQRISKLLNAPSHGTDMWWYHNKDSEQLTMLSPGSLLSDNKPILIIGDTFSYEYGRIDIDKIIAVDCCDTDIQDMILSFCILIEGRFVSSTSIDISCRGALCDGRSEFGGSDQGTNDDIISDSGAEESHSLHNVPATSAMKKRYYCIYGISYLYNIHIEHVISIQEGLLIDQKPLNVLYTQRNQAIIYGTHGLLGVIHMTSSSTTTTTTDDLTPTNNSNIEVSSSDESHEDIHAIPLSPARVHTSLNTESTHISLFSPVDYTYRSSHSYTSIPTYTTTTSTSTSTTTNSNSNGNSGSSIQSSQNDRYSSYHHRIKNNYVYISLTCDYESPIFKSKYDTNLPPKVSVDMNNTYTSPCYDESHTLSTEEYKQKMVSNMRLYGHMIDATITCVSYQANVGILVSGDHHGCVCIWNLNEIHINKTSYEYLLATPIILSSHNMKSILSSKYSYDSSVLQSSDVSTSTSLSSTPVSISPSSCYNSTTIPTSQKSTSTTTTTTTTTTESLTPSDTTTTTTATTTTTTATPNISSLYYGSRIYSLHLSPSGHMICVALYDRLLAIHLHLHLSTSTTTTTPAAAATAANPAAAALIVSNTVTDDTRVKTSPFLSVGNIQSNQSSSSTNTKSSALRIYRKNNDQVTDKEGSSPSMKSPPKTITPHPDTITMINNNSTNTTSSKATSQPYYTLYIRGILDIVSGCRARYQISYQDQNIIIWRMMNVATPAFTSSTCTCTPHSVPFTVHSTTASGRRGYINHNNSLQSWNNTVYTQRHTINTINDTNTNDTNFTFLNNYNGINIDNYDDHFDENNHATGGSTFNTKKIQIIPEYNGEGGGITITTWIHSNLDHIDQRISSSTTGTTLTKTATSTTNITNNDTTTIISQNSNAPVSMKISQQESLSTDKKNIDMTYRFRKFNFFSKLSTTTATTTAAAANTTASATTSALNSSSNSNLCNDTSNDQSANNSESSHSNYILTSQLRNSYEYIQENAHNSFMNNTHEYTDPVLDMMSGDYTANINNDMMIDNSSIYTTSTIQHTVDTHDTEEMTISHDDSNSVFSTLFPMSSSSHILHTSTNTSGNTDNSNNHDIHSVADTIVSEHVLDTNISSHDNRYMRSRTSTIDSVYSLPPEPMSSQIVTAHTTYPTTHTTHNQTSQNHVLNGYHMNYRPAITPYNTPIQRSLTQSVNTTDSIHNAIVPANHNIMQHRIMMRMLRNHTIPAHGFISQDRGRLLNTDHMNTTTISTNANNNNNTISRPFSVSSQRTRAFSIESETATSSAPSTLYEPSLPSVSTQDDNNVIYLDRSRRYTASSIYSSGYPMEHIEEEIEGEEEREGVSSESIEHREHSVPHVEDSNSEINVNYLLSDNFSTLRRQLLYDEIVSYTHPTTETTHTTRNIDTSIIHPITGSREYSDHHIESIHPPSSAEAIHVYNHNPYSMDVTTIESGHPTSHSNDTTATTTTATTATAATSIVTNAVTQSQLYVSYMREMISHFQHDSSETYHSIQLILIIILACLENPPLGLIANALEYEESYVYQLINQYLLFLVTISSDFIIHIKRDKMGLVSWLTHTSHYPNTNNTWNTVYSLPTSYHEFHLDLSVGHNYLCTLYLKYCGNKSIAIEHTWQEYLRTYGCLHLRRSSRTLRRLTDNVRKLDETASIKGTLPRQLGYVTGLQEIYARRVGLYGRLPSELGELIHLRVLSMGNNRICGEIPSSFVYLKNLQRIVLHQNKLIGSVPSFLNTLGCIVNLAGNSGLEHGADVPHSEKEALIELYHATHGQRWNIKTHWLDSNEPVNKWYKVGVLASHVHSIVMSSNGMDGRLPSAIGQLTHLRMIELATMSELKGPIPKQLCTLTQLRRLCICRCGLTGKIPDEIGQLVALEELQLFGNKLTGSIPTSIGKLVNLKLLSLGEYTGGNDFTPGPLPACLATLHNLEALFIANCNIRGILPEWLCQLKELRQLDLQRNNICGAIPPSIQHLSNLLYLNLKDNTYLCGPLPVKELCVLNKLNRLSLVHCNFEQPEDALEILQVHLPRCKIWI